MTIDQFLTMQDQLLLAFGWYIRWWLILFAVAGILLAAFLFVLRMVSTWLDRFGQ